MTRYVILALLCVVAAIAYVQRYAVSVPLQGMQRDLDLSPKTLGQIMAAYYWGYGALQVPAGWFADWWGSRRSLALYALLWSLLTAAMALATSSIEVLALSGLAGAAQAGVFPCAAKSIGSWFPNTQTAWATGLLAASMSLGGAASTLLVAELLRVLPWPAMFVVVAIPGLLWAVAYFVVVPDRQPVLAVTSNDNDDASGASTIGNKLADVSMWLLCGQQFLRGAAMVFFMTWFPRFLQATRQLTEIEAGRLASWPQLGALAGGLAGGAASDWILRRTGIRRLARQGIAVAGMLVCAATFLIARTIPETRIAVAIMTFGAFAAAFGGISGYTVAIEFGGCHVGTVFSIMNTCGNIGAGLFPLVVGYLIGYEGGWDLVVYSIAGIFFADAILWALLNPTDSEPRLAKRSNRDLS